MDIWATELKKLFLKANDRFLKKDIGLFKSGISERTLCGALKGHLDIIKEGTKFKNYYADVEYNRNKNGTIKTCCFFDENKLPKPVTINCDLIVHSRGENVRQDNLIAIEMKKSNRPQKEKEDDRRRIIALTKESYDDVWLFDGKTLPEHVCRYKLGIYYEINFSKKFILLEYYYRGNLEEVEKISLDI